MLLGITLIWNMFALVFLFLLSDGFRTFSMDIGSILVGLFVLIGIFLMGQTLLQYLRYQRFGPVRFDLNPFPGHIGGEVGGNIRISKRLDPFVIPEAYLTCYRLRVTGSGKNRRVVRDTLWSDQAERPTIRSRGSDDAIIPVRFQVPDDLPSASVERLGNGDIVWELFFRMKVKGPDLVATFDIPVFNIR